MPESPYDIIEFAAHEGTNDQEILELLEDPESAFVEKELTPEQQQMAVAYHESLIGNPQLFIGAGNDGFVYEQPVQEGNPVCMKHIWEDLSVEIKQKRFDLLSTRLKELRKIQDHFEVVHAKRRSMQAKGIEFVAPNSPMVEAGIQVAARSILEQAGFHNAVPSIFSVMRIESKGEGSVESLPYVFNEVADIIAMEKVNGRSIQDLILEYEKYFDVIERIDVDAFKEALIKMLSTIHEKELTHQDVTNRNVMLDFGTLMPVIIDFGKACYRTGSFTKEQEIEHAEVICRTLSSFKKDPEKTRKELKRLLAIAF